MLFGIIFALILRPSACGLLGAGTGEGSCAAAPFRAYEVKWPYGCPSFAPCCSEYGYCRPLEEWEYGKFRDCNGVSNGTPLPPETILAESQAGPYHGKPAGEIGPPPDVIKSHIHSPPPILPPHPPLPAPIVHHPPVPHKPHLAPIVHHPPHPAPPPVPVLAPKPPPLHFSHPKPHPIPIPRPAPLTIPKVVPHPKPLPIPVSHPKPHPFTLPHPKPHPIPVTQPEPLINLHPKPHPIFHPTPHPITHHPPPLHIIPQTPPTAVLPHIKPTHPILPTSQHLQHLPPIPPVQPPVLSTPILKHSPLLSPDNYLMQFGQIKHPHPAPVRHLPPPTTPLRPIIPIPPHPVPAPIPPPATIHQETSHCQQLVGGGSYTCISFGSPHKPIYAYHTRYDRDGVFIGHVSGFPLEGTHVGKRKRKRRSKSKDV